MSFHLPLRRFHVMVCGLLLCRMSLKCSGLYLSQFRCTSPHLLASGDGTKSAHITGDVYIHPSAKVHPTAKVVTLWKFYTSIFLFLSNFHLHLFSICDDVSKFLACISTKIITQGWLFGFCIYCCFCLLIKNNLSALNFNRLVQMFQYLPMSVLELVQGSLTVLFLMMWKSRYLFSKSPTSGLHKWCILLLTWIFVLKENAVLIHAIIGWKSSIGRWSRVQVSSELLK